MYTHNVMIEFKCSHPFSSHTRIYKSNIQHVTVSERLDNSGRYLYIKAREQYSNLAGFTI